MSFGKGWDAWVQGGVDVLRIAGKEKFVEESRRL